MIDDIRIKIDSKLRIRQGDFDLRSACRPALAVPEPSWWGNQA